MTQNTRNNDQQVDTLERATAIHEAGHAVMAYVLQRVFTSIAVMEDEDSYGRVTHALPGRWFRPDIDMNARTRNVIEDQIMILLAGPETERAWFARQPAQPQSWHNHIDSAAKWDRGKAVDLGSYVSGGEPELEAYLEWLRQRVLNHTGRAGADDDVMTGRPMVERFWTLVEDLADAVQAARRLSWRRAREVLREADPFRHPKLRRPEGRRE